MEGSYWQFVQRVRRHRPSDLLKASASISIRNHLDERTRNGPPLHPDFALAAACKAAIVHGNEHRAAGVTMQDLRDVCGELVNVGDPFIDDKKLGSFLVRVAYEQFPYQVHPFNDLARTRALLIESAEQTAQGVIKPEFWSSVLSCSLDELVGLAIFLHSGALRNCGIYNPGWLCQPNFKEVFDILPRPVIERVVASHFVVTRGRFRELAAQSQLQDPQLKRYEFNPLLVGPFIELEGQRPIAPILRPILYRATPGSLYYVGVEAAGTVFTEALGRVFEHYVGRQLQLCGPDALIPEVGYDTGKKSVDFIVVMPKAILLVEAKATPLTQHARLGGDRLQMDFARAAGKGIDQIERTAGLIRARHPAFSAIPADRAILGLVVTMEPYYQCDTDLVFRRNAGSVPTSLCSAWELEQLMSLVSLRADEVLLKMSASTRGSISHALQTLTIGCNEVLDQAWSKYPFGLRSLARRAEGV